MKEYSIFVSSPSDVQEERTIISNVINEINSFYEHDPNIPRLKLIDLKTNVRPTINDNEPQRNIDEQIEDNYNVFIGILWRKYGTPTENYESGTEQEFYNAFNKYKANKDSMDILFYFRVDLPKTSNELNVEDLYKIEKFKKEIGKKGFYKEYKSIQEFEELIKNDLRNFILEKRESSNNNDDIDDKIDKHIEEFLEKFTEELSKS